jgi:hypothetical protein
MRREHKQQSVSVVCCVEVLEVSVLRVWGFRECDDCAGFTCVRVCPLGFGDFGTVAIAAFTFHDTPLPFCLCPCLD